MKANVRLIKKHRKFSEEFKRNLVREFEKGMFSVVQLEKLHGIGNTIIYKWIYKYSTFNEKGSRIIEMKDSNSQKVKNLEKRKDNLSSVNKKENTDYVKNDISNVTKEEFLPRKLDINNK